MLAGSTWKNLNMQSSQIPSVPLSDGEHHTQFIAPPPHPSPRTTAHHAPDCAAPVDQDTSQHLLRHATPAPPLLDCELHILPCHIAAARPPVAAQTTAAAWLHEEPEHASRKLKQKKRNHQRAYPPDKNHLNGHRTMEHPD